MSEPPRFLDQVRLALRSRRYSFRTEQAYVGWIKRFILFHQKRHPASMGSDEVNQFLSHLAVEERVSASTQNQALSALIFLYSSVLEQPLPRLEELIRAQRPKRLPVVLSRREIRELLGRMSGTPLLIATLLYGTGMRLLECLRLRVKDLDFDRGEILIRDGKGRVDRRTMLPQRLREALRGHLVEVRRIFEADLEEGYGSVELPDALARKYPAAPREWGWQYVFPSSRKSVDPRSGIKRRHHLDESVVQKAVRSACRVGGGQRALSCHTLRHSFATHLLESGYDGARGVESPVDRLDGPDEQPDEQEYPAKLAVRRPRLPALGASKPERAEPDTHPTPPEPKAD